ncbi:MAG: 5'/3'-nucleotidase SurE [Paludibacteraceae bacterium]|jgi:5'-nucleotidase|nr:5'/3'-nucleotidase SurE [Paludibacteraceae bacterium]MBP9017695.1 5'/3'-nucleotidase SurE [Paludibacteraceae bacterium]
MNKNLILISNDDGIDAKGIKILTKLMQQLGDVVVVAPDVPRSAQSNALTVTQPIRFRKIEEEEGMIRYSCTGTPTDCVKIALNEILNRKPDLLVSGINHGSNSAINVIYSGTMGAVFEGCENGIPSIGFSLASHFPDPDFGYFEPYVLKIAQTVLEKALPESVCLNVNAPCGEIRGVRVSRQCKGYWTKEFAGRTDPAGRAYYWLTGYFENMEPDAEDTDEWAISHGFISIVPDKIDLTAYEAMETIRSWDL